MTGSRSLGVPSLAKVLAENEVEQVRREAEPTYNQPPWAEPEPDAPRQEAEAAGPEPEAVL